MLNRKERELKRKKVVPISVSGKRRDWLALGKKISRGMAIEEAAQQCGIPIEEVYQYITDRSAKVDTLNFELRMFAQGAVKNAMAKLTELAQGEQRERGTTEFNDEGKPARSITFGPDDLEAAKTLAKFALDALRLAKVAGARSADDGQDDLFDKAPETDPWKLKKIE